MRVASPRPTVGDRTVWAATLPGLPDAGAPSRTNPASAASTRGGADRIIARDGGAW